jgi:putative two-component system response regulator
MKVRSGFLAMAEQIARSHHEHWDGGGYAEGLSGEQIPLAARIFSLADVYDALTTARPYKPAYSHEQALQMMREERGQIFDPRLYDTFIEAAGTFDRIRRDFAEP